MFSRPALALALFAVLPPLLRAAPGDVHLALGNPSGAEHDPKNPDPLDYLLVKDQFALSYNSKRGGPNWVSYRLRKSDCGRAPRGDFFPDPELPRPFYQVKPGDYRFNQTGMTRGHLCPNSHRNNTEANARATFVMTNMVPQTEELNAGAWNELEIWCRDMVFRNNWELFIVCGGHGAGGRTDKGFYKTIHDGRITVPNSCWKVILMLDGPFAKDPVERVTKKSRPVAVIMPNDRSPEKADWRDYQTTIAEVEKLTGYAFFDKAPKDILETLKSRKDRYPLTEREKDKN